MSTSPAEARIEILEQIEEDVIAILRGAGNCMQEIGKDRPSQKAVDGNVQQVDFQITRRIFAISFYVFITS